MGAFSKSIETFSKNTLKRVDNECRYLALHLFSRIIDYTPQQVNGAKYSKGWLVNNWRFGVAEWKTDMDTTFRSTIKNPKSADSVETRLVNMLRKQGIFYKDNFVTMLNESPYAYRAEKLGWPEEINPTSNWHYWTGTVEAYHMVARGFLDIPSKYK
jgi:hypothetical protein